MKILAVLSVLFFLSGCANMTNTEQRMVSGSAIGGTIAGPVGAGLGAGIGWLVDRSDRK